MYIDAYIINNIFHLSDVVLDILYTYNDYTQKARFNRADHQTNKNLQIKSNNLSNFKIIYKSAQLKYIISSQNDLITGCPNMDILTFQELI